MSELDQLKADLAAFKRVRECSGKYGFNHGPSTIYAIASIEAKIKELETPEDLAECLNSKPTKCPAVWCLKNYQTAYYTNNINNTRRLFPSMLEAADYARRHGLYWLKADVYTGEESE